MVINGEETSEYGQGIFKMRKKKLIGFDNQAESQGLHGDRWGRN